MGVGACTISNDPAELKDLFIKARIEGKSWKQIQDEFGFSSVQVARKTFRQITGINNLKLKGKAFKNAVDNDLVDLLQKAVAKKPPVGNTGAAAPSTSATATSGAQGGISQQVATLGDDVAKTMQATFPNKPTKLVLDNADEVGYYSDNYVKNRILKQAASQQGDLVKAHDLNKINGILDDIKAGKYYSDITKKHGVTFADVDAVFWTDAVQTQVYTGGGNARTAIWQAYKKKPTSEFGFKAVQDQVWELKKLGATSGQIVDGTGIDAKVVDLILKNQWSLPAKGSKQYVGFTADFTAAAGPSSQQTAAQIIGESNSFKNMTAADADRWVATYGQDLTTAQYNAVRSYTSSSYREYNGYLRGGTYVADGSRAETTINHIRAALRPAPDDVTVYRGVGSDAFPKGVPSVGDAYMDRGFLSTSYGGKSAFGGDYRLIIDVPKGTPSRAVHNLSLHKSEREVILGDSLKMVVTGVKKGSSRYDPTEVYLKVIL